MHWAGAGSAASAAYDTRHTVHNTFTCSCRSTLELTLKSDRVVWSLNNILRVTVWQLACQLDSDSVLQTLSEFRTAQVTLAMSGLT